jgi:hypothetical protein
MDNLAKARIKVGEARARVEAVKLAAQHVSTPGESQPAAQGMCPVAWVKFLAMNDTLDALAEAQEALKASDTVTAERYVGIACYALSAFDEDAATLPGVVLAAGERFAHEAFDALQAINTEAERAAA